MEGGWGDGGKAGGGGGGGGGGGTEVEIEKVHLEHSNCVIISGRCYPGNAVKARAVGGRRLCSSLS